jgi:hypothetical protein
MFKPECETAARREDMLLRESAVASRATGLSASVIVFSVLGPPAGVLATALGRREVAEAVRGIALLIDHPAGGLRR